MTRRLLIVWCSMTGGTRQLAMAARSGACREAGEPQEPASPRQPAPACACNGAADTTGPPDGERRRRVDVVLRRADEAGPADVLAASAYLFATPENLASMAGVMKDFFDRSYYAALERVNGRAYGSIVCAGSDGQGALRQVERIAAGWRLRTVAQPLIVCVRAQTPQAILSPKSIAPAELERAAELGATLAAGLAMGLW